MPKVRPKRHISLKMPALLLDRIDRQAAAEGRSRSNMICHWLAQFTDSIEAKRARDQQAPE